MKLGIFRGSFENEEDIISEFQISKDCLSNKSIIYAVYDTPDWEGSAEVYFLDHRTQLFYEVHASHCSCYGLEDQWEPELIGDEALFLEYAKTRKVYTAESDYSQGTLADFIL